MMKETITEHFQGDCLPFFQKYLTDIKSDGGNGKYKALCPLHADSKPSFTFNSSMGVFKCFGCGKGGDIFDFYGELRSLSSFPDILKGIASDFGITDGKKTKGNGRIVAKYDYTDESGKLLFQVCRMDPKDFRQRKPNGKGFTWGVKGVRRVLYQLPAVMKADEVLIVEGEKDCDNLLTLGFTATTCPMGAGKWDDQYNKPLKGKAVVLIPDNDDQGREHMAKVAGSLDGKTESLKLLELPGLPDKGDVSDFIASFGDDKADAGERLAILIENTEDYKPVKKPTIEGSILTSFDFTGLKMATKTAFLAPWLKQDSINLVTGYRGVGKTWFALGIGGAVTKGVSFGPWECKEPADFLLLDGEMPAEDIQERLLYMGLGQSKRFHIYSDALCNQQGLPRADLTNESWRAKMKSILLSRKIKLWVVDNLASLARGLDENSKQDWDPVNNWLLELRFAGIATILLHHTNKAGGQRGTSGREDNLDTSLLLKPPAGFVAEDGCRFVVSFSKTRVRTKDLYLTRNVEFKLIEDESGMGVWTWGNVKLQNKKAVLELFDEGLTATEIARDLEIDKGYVSRIRKQAVKDGHLDSKSRLTQTGFLYAQN